MTEGSWIYTSARRGSAGQVPRRLSRPASGDFGSPIWPGATISNAGLAAWAGSSHGRDLAGGAILCGMVDSGARIRRRSTPVPRRGRGFSSTTRRAYHERRHGAGPLSVGLEGNAAEIRAGARHAEASTCDLVTRPTASADPLTATSRLAAR